MFLKPEIFFSMDVTQARAYMIHASVLEANSEQRKIKKQIVFHTKKYTRGWYWTHTGKNQIY
jgi:hypothetical protein